MKYEIATFPSKIIISFTADIFCPGGEGGGGSWVAAGQIFLELFSMFLFSFQRVVRRCSDLGCDQYLTVVILN